MARLPCDLIITPHPTASNLDARLAGAAPSSTPSACADYAAAAAAGLDQRLAEEARVRNDQAAIPRR